jgi:hypothetical protein
MLPIEFIGLDKPAEGSIDFESWRLDQLEQIARVFQVPRHLINTRPAWYSIDWAEGPRVEPPHA